MVPPVGAGGDTVGDQDAVNIARNALEFVAFGDLKHQRSRFVLEFFGALHRDLDPALHGPCRDDEFVDRVVFAFDGVVEFACDTARRVVGRRVVDGLHFEGPVMVGDHAQQFHRYGLPELLHRFVQQGERCFGREIAVQTLGSVAEIEFVLLRGVVHQPRVGAGEKSTRRAQDDEDVEYEFAFHMPRFFIVCNCLPRLPEWASCRSRRRCRRKFPCPKW